MLVFPNCKINLGLNITNKRTDGYHDLETVFLPVQFTDALEVIRAEVLKFDLSGLMITGDLETNLCYKAYQLLKADYPSLPAIHCQLHKAIPMGAGLGGGSSDGAFMLKLLNEQFNLQLNEDQLKFYALKLGSDCPFFIINKPCFATGRGEYLEPIELDISAYKLLLINPGIHISTKEAFAGLTPTKPSKSIREIIQQPIITWKEELVNDFEKTIFPLHASIKNIKEELYALGAVYASMTGTGSTVYGIFNKSDEPPLDAFEAYFTKWV